MKRHSTLIDFKGFLSFLILYELSKKERYGEELAEMIGKRKGSKLSPGTIYPALKKLLRLKLVKVKKVKRKKYYSLTKKGERELERQLHLFSQYFYGLKKYIKRKK